jgi:60S ribosomal subunit assembly/export protein LOC1
MMTILAMVNAEKEGQIESKMIKARQMEEIREAKRNEADVRQESKKAKLVSCQHQTDIWLSCVANGGIPNRRKQKNR